MYLAGGTELTIEGVVRRHLEHLQMRNLAPTSVYARDRILRRLRKWFGGPILYMTETDIQNWQAARFRELAASGVRAESVGVREFFRWAVKERYLDDDPTLRMILPNVARGLPRPISDRHLAEAIAEASPATAAIIGLAAFAGLRAVEISRLSWPEVRTHGAEPQIHILSGKGGRGRVVPLSQPLSDLLSHLPQDRGPVIGRRDGGNGHTHPWNISGRANQHLHSLGFTDTLHQARHRFASATYAHCQDIVAVADLLGHASTNTTRVYALSPPGVAVRAVQAASELRSA